MKRLIAITITALTVLPVFAQRNITLKADKAFEAGKYFDAIDEYKYAYAKAKDKDKKNQILFMVAESYRMVQNYKQAENYYRKVVKKNFDNPLATLYMADALRAQGKYEEAMKEYQNYSKLNPSDDRGPSGIESCSMAVEWMAQPTRYQIEPMHYFNSKYSDFGITYAKDDYSMVIFSSSREGCTGGKISGVTGEYYCDLFRSRVDRKGKWSEPVPLEANINTDLEEGMPCTNKKCNTLYFTSFREDKNKNMVCKIFCSVKENAEWADPTELNLAPDTVAVGHPAISSDELTLIFVADMSGGYGGKDLWKTTRANKSAEWGKPVNMGPAINTPGDEMFPFIHPDGTFYFSSNGHPGMGGLDIFKAVETNSGWKVENMKYPINSSSDDFSICFEAEMERGYFCSNRSARGDDDIYQFSLPPIEFTLTGVVRNGKTDAIIAGAEVNLIGSDGTNITAKTETDGSYNFNLSPNADYRIVVKRGGFLNSKDKTSTKGLTDSEQLKVDIDLSPDDRRMDLDGIEYEFNSAKLKPSSIAALEELVEILNDNANITIEIGSHADYRGSDEANKKLSDARAKSVVDFLTTYGIDRERLDWHGYGEEMPKEVDKGLLKSLTEKRGINASFLKEGDILTESFIKRLTEEQQEICNQLNRRTDFVVTGRDYVPKVRKRR
ncbi:MAG: OmpA family protein [Salinivirgaceae bacterium]|nr:OmpA family protein [Salinivirgaceae bacterium]